MNERLSFWQLRVRWRRAGVLALITVAVLLVLRLVSNVWTGHELDVEIARLEKLYGRLDVATLAPPKVTPAENRARVVRAAAALAAVTLRDQTHLNFMFSSSAYRPAAYMDSARALVEQNRLAVDVARHALSRPKSNWDIDYEDQSGMPRFMDLRGLSTLLMAACGVDLDGGRADQAANASAAGLAEAASLVHEPITIVQLMRTSIAEAQMRCVRAVLDRGAPSAPALAELAQALAENRTPNLVKSTLVGELKYVNGLMARGENGSSAGATGGHGLAGWLFNPFTRLLRLRYLRATAHLIEIEQIAPFARRQPAAEPTARTRSAPPWWHVGERLDATFLSGLDSLARSLYRYESELNLAEIAVALRRYRLDQGTYPDTLDRLAPRYVARVPVDPFTGRPPEYSPRGSGFDLKGQGPKTIQAADRDLLEWRVSR